MSRGPGGKGGPERQTKRKEKEENLTKREGQGPQRVYCPRAPNIRATPLCNALLHCYEFYKYNPPGGTP